MQIRIAPDGDWHKPATIGDGTACALEVFAFASRDGGLDCLCPVCFTPAELERAAIEIIAGETDLHLSRFDDQDDPTDPTGATIIAAIEKAKTP